MGLSMYQNMKNRKYKILAGLIVALLMVGGGIWSSMRTPSSVDGNSDEITNETDDNIEEEIPQGTPSNTPATPTQTSKNANLAYSDAVRLYANRRLQFDSNCIVTPYYVVFKKGTTIMLDNRYEKPRTVSLDGVVYKLPAYGFKLVTLTSTKKLPYTMKIDCGNGKNNAQIFLEQ